MASFNQLEHQQKRLNAPSAMSEPAHDSVVEELKKGQSNILVAVRLRPMLMKEVEQGQFNLIKMLDDKVVILQDPQDLSEQYTSELRKKRTRQKQYAFDYAFDQDAQQDQQHLFQDHRFVRSALVFAREGSICDELKVFEIGSYL